MRVNGKTVAEFKNTTDATITLDSAPTHFIEVVPFMGDAAAPLDGGVWILPGGVNVRVAGSVYEPLTRSRIDAKDVGSSRRYCGPERAGTGMEYSELNGERADLTRLCT